MREASPAVDGPAPIGLSEFAAISERTENEYQTEMFGRLRAGKMFSLLTSSAEADLSYWIADNGYLNGKQFVVCFNLSQNRLRNVVLYCVCEIDMSRNEPKVNVLKMIPGFADKSPVEAYGKKGFQIFFCDMNPNL